MIERFRQRGVLLGAAYRHGFRHRLGVHAALSFGVGLSHIGFAIHTSGSCCYPTAKRVAPSFASELEFAPLFGSTIYFAPGLLVRFMFPLERTATLTNGPLDEEQTRTIRFPPALVAFGARCALGARFGRHHEVDVGFGFDVGKPVGQTRFLGFMARIGVALGDLARR